MSQQPQGAQATPTYIYIAGRGHSGSTLLTLLLARHPRVAAIGELSLLSLQIARDESTRWVGLCSCGERPMECPVWGRILKEVENEENLDIARDPFSWRVSDVGMEEEHRSAAPLRVPFVWLRHRLWRLVRYLQYLSPRVLGKLLGFYKPQATWAENRSRVVSRLAAINQVDAIVDASKDSLDMLDVYHHATVPVKIIFLTRDSRGNVWSMLKRLKPGASREDKVTPAAREWVKVNGRIWKLVQQVPEADCMHLRYEDLCRNPREVMNRLFAFVGLDAFDVVSARDASDREAHTIGGNKIRFSSEPLNIREDTAWSKNLTEQELHTIRSIAGALSDELGYEN